MGPVAGLDAVVKLLFSVSVRQMNKQSGQNTTIMNKCQHTHLELKG